MTISVFLFLLVLTGCPNVNNNDSSLDSIKAISQYRIKIESTHDIKKIEFGPAGSERTRVIPDSETRLRLWGSPYIKGDDLAGGENQPNYFVRVSVESKDAKIKVRFTKEDGEAIPFITYGKRYTVLELPKSLPRISDFELLELLLIRRRAVDPKSLRYLYFNNKKLVILVGIL